MHDLELADRLLYSEEPFRYFVSLALSSLRHSDLPSFSEHGNGSGGPLFGRSE